jgi:hypothetical protein
MKKICLVVVGIYLKMFGAFSQTLPTADSSQFHSRKLTFEEADLVSSYYNQDGDHSAVTGGIGTEKLVDVSNTIDVLLHWYNKHDNKNNLTLEGGIDHYTSASSDKIDPRTISSASSRDTRIYPSASWSVENDKKGTTVGVNVSASKEFDYLSFGFGASFLKRSKDKSREFGVKAQAYLDEVTIILPYELRKDTTFTTHYHEDYPTTPRNSFSASFTLSQIVNKNFQFMLLADVVYQQGFLSLPFHRVYFNDHSSDSLRTELLPSSRFKIPLGIRGSYFLGDNIILRGFYRFYSDDWGLVSNTIDLETSFKATPFFSLTPFYRFYTQTAVKYFAGYKLHNPTDQYYTSNYDLSGFSSSFFGLGFRIAPPNGILGNPHFNSLEMRYGHYIQTTDLVSDIISLNLTFR